VSIKDAVVVWDCPRCGEQVSKTIAWLKHNLTYDCPNCGANVTLPPGPRMDTLSALEQVSDISDQLSRDTHTKN
jgi:endogenous inhibitor of DNA gyrase (YacG/DUF329 family)